ncbi:MAG TPA: sulfatase-like hydrolase/transferase [Candidatus Eisenbergiella merdavium]|uniref:Sulfatase-like hydrolase/transferase n=1 Tax=Candidatus Eisenbergiella merdavium TaxID=2838551 RepID=A0A9D2NH38_9FIRM|nr:sulfatase-like hydrolase/transferase [Candidatus Eisenbergiella merdavium]
MSTRPNVVVFFTDQQRWDTTGIHGNPCGLTPNFDQAAMEGTFPEYAFTPQPVCGPARGVLQTGMYATSIGTYKNAIPLNPDLRTMAHYFNEAGYETGYIGKWHLGSTRHAVPERERGGYQYWLGANALEATSQAYNTLVYDNADRPVKLPGYRVDALTDAAIRYIDQNKEKPFFLFLSFLEPHFQNSNDSYPAPTVETRKRYDYMPPDLASLGGNSWQSINGYYGMVKRLDEAFGRVRDALKSLQLSENTILLFTTDHGCHFKTRNSEYKRSCHESSIRIPMAFTGGPFTGGGRIRSLVSLVDVAPTLLDACGIPVPEDMQGHSLMPLIDRSCKDWPEEIFVQISESQVGRAVRTSRWKYAVEAPDKDPMTDPGSDTYTETALYDLEHDPYELTNLIGYESHRQVADIMAERLKKAMIRAGESEPVILKAPPVPSGQRRVFPGEELL